MKTIKMFAVVFLLSGLFVSCSNDDENEVSNSELVGEWQLEEYFYEGTTQTSQGGQSLSSSYSGEAYDINAKINFDENSWQTQGSYIVKLLTEVNGQSISQDYPFSNYSGSGNYSLEGNVVTLENQNHNLPGAVVTGDEFTITELSANNLVLSFSYEGRSTVSGMEVNIILEGFQRYSR